MKYLYICNGVVVDKIEIVVVGVGWRLTDLLLHTVVVICLSWHRVVVVIGDILHWLKRRSHRLRRHGVEAGLIVLGGGVVGSGGVHIGHGVVSVVLAITGDHLVSIAIGIVMNWSPSEMLSLTYFPRLCDALNSLIAN